MERLSKSCGSQEKAVIGCMPWNGLYHQLDLFASTFLGSDHVELLSMCLLHSLKVGN